MQLCRLYCLCLVCIIKATAFTDSYKIPLMILIMGETDCRVLNFNFWRVLCYDIEHVP